MFAQAGRTTQTNDLGRRPRLMPSNWDVSFGETTHSQPIIQRTASCACGGGCPACQAKSSSLTVSQPNDPAEIEADQVADRIMRMPDDISVAPTGPTRVSTAMPVLQRTEADGEQPKEEGSRCPSWRADPESISKRAGEFYARNHLTPPSQAAVERIQCEPPIANGNYGCYVYFSDGLVLRVIVRETDIVVGTGPGPFTTEHPPPATPLCFYEYSCPEGELVLTVKKCQSAKPSGSSGPPLVAQRAASSGATAPRTAPSIAYDVLNSSGQQLDSATRAFFEPRFGYDLSHVRVHSDPLADQSARDVNAQAYTVGSHIVFEAGRLSPGTMEGRRLLAHELTHVMQQGHTGPGQLQRQVGARPTSENVWGFWVTRSMCGCRQQVRDGITSANMVGTAYAACDVPANRTNVAVEACVRTALPGTTVAGSTSSSGAMTLPPPSSDPCQQIDDRTTFVHETMHARHTDVIAQAQGPAFFREWRRLAGDPNRLNTLRATFPAEVAAFEAAWNDGHDWALDEVNSYRWERRFLEDVRAALGRIC